MLALSKEPQQLVDMVLDSLHHLMGSDYCWVQLINTEDHSLQLVATRGITQVMERVTGLARSQQNLGEQVITGLKVVVPDLSRDGEYGLAPFGKAGICSLVAVPIRTYHNHGVIGLASRTKKQFTEETADLLTTVAGLVGATLNITELNRISSESGLAQGLEMPSSDRPVRPDTMYEQEASLELPDIRIKRNGTFGKHAKIMDVFRENHEE